MPSLAQAFPALIEALRDAPGPSTPGTFPGPGFEALATAYLNAAAGARAAAIVEALRERGLLDPAELADAQPLEVRAALRGILPDEPPRWLPPLSRLAAWYARRAEGLESAATADLRDELRTIKGLGPTTVETLLLMGLGRPAYPLDRGTFRILARHGWIEPEAEFDEVRENLEGLCDHDPGRIAGLSAALEVIAARLCRAGRPRCEDCPLRPLLPEGGPYG